MNIPEPEDKSTNDVSPTYSNKDTNDNGIYDDNLHFKSYYGPSPGRVDKLYSKSFETIPMDLRSIKERLKPDDKSSDKLFKQKKTVAFSRTTPVKSILKISDSTSRKGNSNSLF